MKWREDRIFSGSSAYLGINIARRRAKCVGWARRKHGRLLFAQTTNEWRDDNSPYAHGANSLTLSRRRYGMKEDVAGVKVCSCAVASLVAAAVRTALFVGVIWATFRAS